MRAFSPACKSNYPDKAFPKPADQGSLLSLPMWFRHRYRTLTTVSLFCLLVTACPKASVASVLPVFIQFIFFWPSLLDHEIVIGREYVLTPSGAIEREKCRFKRNPRAVNSRGRTQLHTSKSHRGSIASKTRSESECRQFRVGSKFYKPRSRLICLIL